MGWQRLLEAADDGTQILHHDEDGDRFALERRVDVEGLIERNKALLTEGDGYSPTREWRRVGSFPPVVIEIFRRRWGADPFRRGNEDLLRRLVNDPDLRHFRTAPGRL